MKKSKILVFVLTLALLIASVAAVTAMAEENTPSVEITSKNLSYEDNIRILFAVKAENIGESEVTLNFYEADPQDGAEVKETLTALYTPENSANIGIEGHYVFFTPGLAAKFVSKQVYVQASVTVDGTEYKSEVERYSIVEYCYEMMAKETTDAEDDERFMKVIEYGAAIQAFLTDDGKYEGALATDYKYVTVDGGTLDGVYSAGIYLAGTKLNPTIEGATKLVTDAGEVVDNAAEYTVGDANVSFSMADTKALATETFENATSNNLPSNITFVNTLPKISNLTSTYAESAYVVGKFTNNETNTTNSLFTSNKYQASRAIIQITESAEAEANATMVEFEADLCLDWSTNGDNCEFFNIVLADKDGNAAYNLVLRNYISGNRLILLNRDSSGAMGPKGTQTLFYDADNVWFNLRATYKYVSASEIAVEIFLNGESVRTETVPATAGAAITLENLVNAYVVVNGNTGAHAINSYVAIDNVVFRKIAE